MFIYLFLCLFMDLFVFSVLIIVGHPQEVSLKVLWRSDFIWQRHLGSKKVCFFVCFLFVCCFYFNILGTPTGSYPENFVKIGLDLTDIFRPLNVYLFICLFVCSLICLFLFQLSWGTHRKLLWKFCEDLAWYGWDI